MTTIWIAGRNSDPRPWECLGAYSTEEAAVARCKQRNDFVAPLELDHDLPERRMPWKDAYYPILQGLP
jgi:hypothetical protein